VTDIRVDEVGERDGDDDVRLDGAQDGQVAGGEGVVGQLHQRVAELPGTVPQIALRPVGLHRRFEHGLDLLPADRVELEPAGHPAVVVPGEGQRPAFGGVGFGTVGVEPLQVVVHHLGEVGVRPGGGDVGQGGIDRGEVDVLLRGGGDVLVAGDRGDHGDLVGGEAAVGERGGDRGQVCQRAAVAHHLRRCGRGESGVAAQPGLHRLQPVVLRRLGEFTLPDRPGDLCLDPVLRAQQPAGAVEHLRAEHRLEVRVGQAVQRALQIRERVTRTTRTHVRRITAGGHSSTLKPQVRRPPTVSRRGLHEAGQG
jgi:hypothetical protein